MIRKYHNHKMQTTPWHREEELLNHHETPGRQIKQSKPRWAWKHPKHQAPTISSIDKSSSLNLHRVWSPTNQRAIKEESKVANRNWIDHQTCSLLQYINVIANLFYNGKLFKWTALKNYKSQQSSSIYTPSHHRIQVPKVLGAREIWVQFGIKISNHSIIHKI